MSLSTQDYALLSKDVYHTREVGEKVTLGSRGYTVLDSSAPSRMGFQATAYRSADRSEVVIAYRGTEFDREPFKDGAVDVAMVIAGINPQDRSAQSFTQHVMDTVRRDDELSGATTHVSVTGHSLGGTLAELNAARFGLDGQTFNAYGAKGLNPVAPQVVGTLTDHARAGDPVSAASLHLGNSRIYAAQQDVDRIGAAGYGHRDRFDNLRTVLAVDFSSHGIENFIPNNDLLGSSILSAETEARYRSNQDLIDTYRSDIYAVRSHASVAWETRRAIVDHLQTAGRSTVEGVQHESRSIAMAVGDGAAHTYHEASVVSRQIGAAASRLEAGAIISARALDLVPNAAADAVWGSRTGSPDLDRMLHPPKLTDADHPGHALYEQALRGVHAIDAATGRRPDHMSENLAAALTVEARRHGLGRIDHVTMSEDFSRAYAVQGGLGSPFKQFAEVPTEIGIATSVDRSSAEWRSLEQPSLARQDVPNLPMSQTAQTESPSPNHGSPLSR